MNVSHHQSNSTVLEIPFIEKSEHHYVEVPGKAEYEREVTLGRAPRSRYFEPTIVTPTRLEYTTC